MIKPLRAGTAMHIKNIYIYIYPVERGSKNNVGNIIYVYIYIYISSPHLNVHQSPYIYVYIYIYICNMHTYIISIHFISLIPKAN